MHGVASSRSSGSGRHWDALAGCCLGYYRYRSVPLKRCCTHGSGYRMYPHTGTPAWPCHRDAGTCIRQSTAGFDTASNPHAFLLRRATYATSRAHCVSAPPRRPPPGPTVHGVLAAHEHLDRLRQGGQGCGGAAGDRRGCSALGALGCGQGRPLGVHKWHGARVAVEQRRGRRRACRLEDGDRRSGAQTRHARRLRRVGQLLGCQHRSAIANMRCASR